MLHKIVLFIIVSLFLGLTLYMHPNHQFSITFCDVGQGDAAVIQYGTFQVLVDGGPNDSVLTCLGEQMPFFDRTIELVVATHQDSDHIGGLPSVFASYRVAQLAWNGEEKETTDFQTFNQAIQMEEAKGMTAIVPAHGQRINIDSNLALTYWFPRVASKPAGARLNPQCEIHLQDTMSNQLVSKRESNDGSIVLFIKYEQVSMLLMGDLESGGELTLACINLLKPTTIVKVGHHGSKSSSSQVFMDMTQPEYAVFSVGKNNRFGHPSPEVMSRYDLLGSKVLRTDQLGSIVFLSDGVRVWREESLFSHVSP